MLSYHGAMHEMLGRQPVGTVLDSAQHREEQAPPTLPREARAGSSGRLEGRRPSKDSGSALDSAEAGVFSFSPLRKAMRSTSFSSGSLLQSIHPADSASKLGEVFNGNINHFAYLTSGFHSVNDSVLRRLAESVSECTAPPLSSSATGAGGDSATRLAAIVNAGELTRNYDDLMIEFHQAFLSRDEGHMDAIECVIFLRKVCEVFGIQIVQSYSLITAQLKERVDWLLGTLRGFRPGDAMPKELQLLKGCMRETEVDRVWALSRMPMTRIHHMRSKFYTDDFFCPMPSLEDDALPFANLVRDRQPELLTVAFDPEGTGPDTHYKVLQVVAAGLKMSLARGDVHSPDLTVWGYRNVWFVFAPSESTIMIPATAEDLDLMHSTFMACFTTQKEASYPSPHYDGPFSLWARHLQVQQRQQLVTLLGQEYFDSHKDPRVRAAEGFIFLKAMRVNQFLEETEELKSKFQMV